MKKIAIVLTALAVMMGAGLVMAGMDDVAITATSLKPACVQTNSYVVRGEIRALEMSCGSTPSSTVTATVAVVYNGATILSKSFTNTTVFYPLVLHQGSTGTDLSSADVTNTVTPTYGYIPVAGVVTQTITALGGATNTWTSKLVFWK